MGGRMGLGRGRRLCNLFTVFGSEKEVYFGHR